MLYGINYNTLMSFYAVKQSGESNERLLNRFKKQVQRSRILIEAKEKMFHQRQPKKRHVRNAAIMREHYRKKRSKEQFAIR